MRKLILSSLLLFVCTLVTLGQSGSVKGFVYDKGTGEPVLFSPVFLVGTKLGTTTDVNGFYSITRVPAGTYTLRVTAIGYDTTDLFRI